MLRSVACNAGMRVVASGARLPRYIASPAYARLLSTSNGLLVRPHSLRSALPGSTRNLSLWSSKPPVAAATATPPTPPDQSTIPPAAESFPTDVPEVPDAAASQAADVLSSTPDVISSIPVDVIANIPPMHYGDLAALGLASWSPAGLCQWGMEALHVSTGLPWFWTIIGATVLSRVLLAPFAIQGMRNAAKLAPHQDEIQAISAQMREAFAKKDQFEQQKLQLKQMALYKKLGVNPTASLISPLVQLPVSLGMFFGVRRLCELPVEQLKWSGVSFLPDLTAVDPTWIMPLLTVAAINLQLTVSARDMMASPMAPHLINVFRLVTIPSLWIFGAWPVGIQLNILAGVLTLSVQSLILRVPAIRRALDLPIVAKGTTPSASMLDTYNVIRKWALRKIEDGKALQAPAKSKTDTLRIHTRKRQ